MADPEVEVSIRFTLMFSFLFCVQLWAADTCRNVVEKLGGSAIEMEMDMSPEVLGLLTTTDGTVGGLFVKQKLPEFFTQWMQKFEPNHNPSSYAWDKLGNGMKRDLLIEVTRRKKSGFFTDRQIPNTRVKDKITLEFDRKTTPFLGKWYPKGTHEIDVSGYFGKVEYMGPDSVKDVSGVELHLRSAKLEAGDVLESAWILQDGAKIRRTHMHEHIVVPMPVKALAQKPVKTALAVTEYYRRANLLAEFIAILELEGIYPNKRFSFRYLLINYFDSINPEYISGIFNYLSNEKSRAASLGSTFKMGWVGFRGSDLYDQPNLFGFEFRAINNNSDTMLYRKMMTQIEKGLRDQDYGFNPEIIATGFGVSTEKLSFFQRFNLNSKLKRSWYKKSYRQLFFELPDYLKVVVGNSIKKMALVWSLKKNARGNQAVKMLLYDWSRDPLFYGSPDSVARLEKEQVIALQRHFEKGEDLNIVLRDFIWNSGLLNKVIQTFRMEKADFDFLLKAS